MDRFEDEKKLLAQYQKKYDEAWRNYQDTGNGRYYNSYHRYEVLITALEKRIDNGAKDQEHAALRCAVSGWADQIKALRYCPADLREDRTKKILNEILTVAHVHGLSRED